jgi:hypothetical protein
VAVVLVRKRFFDRTRSKRDIVLRIGSFRRIEFRIREHLRYLYGIDPKEDTIGHYYRGGWLNVAFEYLYAGHDEDAWDFMKKELGPGWQEERRLILKSIEKERFYREIREMQRNKGKRSLVSRGLDGPPNKGCSGPALALLASFVWW